MATIIDSLYLNSEALEICPITTHLSKLFKEKSRLSTGKIFRENETLDVIEFEHLMFKALRIIKRVSIASYSRAQMKLHVFHLTRT